MSPATDVKMSALLRLPFELSGMGAVSYLQLTQTERSDRGLCFVRIGAKNRQASNLGRLRGHRITT